MQYTSNVTYLSNESFTKIPPELVQDLRRMLNPDELGRPSALDFTGILLSEFFLWLKLPYLGSCSEGEGKLLHSGFNQKLVVRFCVRRP